MTELSYLADMESAYIRSFRGKIVALPPGGIVLDRTYFYPAGGGQPSDRGTLSAAGARTSVVDVTRTGESVVHRTRISPSDLSRFAVGGDVEGDIDWNRRHQHMRLHTGQHLLSARAFERTGLRTRKAVLQDLGATIDLEGEIPVAALEAIARDMDDLVQHPRAVTIRHVPRSEWEGLASAGRSGLVPLPAHVDPVRVVEVSGEDSCPCGGTHVRSTGEIGEVRLHPPSLLTGGASRIGFTLTRPGATTPPA